MAIYRVSCVGLQGQREKELKRLARRAATTLRDGSIDDAINNANSRDLVAKDIVAITDEWRKALQRDGIVLWMELCNPYDLGAFLHLEITSLLRPQITVEAGTILYILSNRTLANAEGAIRRQLRRHHWSRMYMNWVLQMLAQAAAETKVLHDTTIAIVLNPLGATLYDAYAVRATVKTREGKQGSVREDKGFGFD